jgi:hypothetical protein
MDHKGSTLEKEPEHYRRIISTNDINSCFCSSTSEAIGEHQGQQHHSPVAETRHMRVTWAANTMQ